MIEKREAIVIGAGPAGSRAARGLAKAGVDVLLVDRDASPGATNACGGFAAQAYRDRLELDDSVVERDIAGTLLRIGDRTWHFGDDRPLYISFRREVFDLFLARQAADAGAELLTSARAHVIDASERRIGLTLPDGQRDVAADQLIFADGPSTLARAAYGIGHRRGTHTKVAGYVELAGEWGDGATAEVFVDPAAPTTGYCWIFPKGDRLNVGLGGPIRGGRPSLSERLEAFIESRDDLRGRERVGRGAGMVPADVAREFSADGALVVGDAAGLVNPMTGGGIAFAVLSGDLAAESIARRRPSSYARRLKLTPHYAWLKAMSLWRGRLDHQPMRRRAVLQARMLRQYFAFFTGMRWCVDKLLGS